MELIDYRNPNCTKCGLHQGAKTVCVWGEGNVNARLMLIGEAPGEEEDIQGRPFIGKSGKLLRNILGEYGLSGKDVYISNTIKCRPPNNRRPHIKEIVECAPYLLKEISTVNPKLIVALGQVAAGVLLGRLRTLIGESRGKVWTTGFKSIAKYPVIVTYHPSAIVRDNTLIEAIFQDFEFIMRVLKDGAPERKPCKYYVGVSPISKHNEVAIDLETEGLNPYDKEKKILCVGSSSHSYRGYSSPHSDIIQHIISDKDICKVGHNIKFDIAWLLTRGYEFNGPIYDTLVGEHLTNENHPNYGLKELTASFTDMGNYTAELEAAKQKAGGDFSKIPIKVLMKYCAQDCDGSWRLMMRQLPKLREEGLMPLANLVMAGERVVARAEVQGVLIDQERHGKLQRIYKRKLKEYFNRFQSEGLENAESSIQLGKFLTGKLGLRVIKRTDTGKVSVDIDALKQLESEDQTGFVKAIIHYRKLRGDYSKYLTPMRTLWQSDGRVHANFRIAGTDTGRYSCNNPNLQAVTRDSPIKSIFRSGFRNGRIIQLDYEQGELRLLAQESRDRKLLRAFKDKLDIHKLTASQIFGIPFNDVSDKQRFVGKTINFGTIYGMGPEKLVSELHEQKINISTATAQKFLHQFRETYPDVKRQIRDRGNEIIENGYVVNLFGRRRRITILDLDNLYEVKKAQRQAFNAPIQGGLHDLNILSTWSLFLKLKNYRSKIILFVHDSILIDSPAEEVKEVCKIAREVFEHPDTSRFGFELTVPMPVSIKVGQNWKEASNAKEQ